jgi:hypothetical protein
VLGLGGWWERRGGDHEDRIRGGPTRGERVDPRLVRQEIQRRYGDTGGYRDLLDHVAHLTQPSLIGVMGDGLAAEFPGQDGAAMAKLTGPVYRGPTDRDHRQQCGHDAGGQVETGKWSPSVTGPMARKNVWI